jgi:hypothetical protein
MRLVNDDKMDPSLEIWIDYSPSSVAVRLVGVLDGTTRSAFLSVMDDLMNEGMHTIEINAGAVEITDELGAAALRLYCRRTIEADQMLIWDGFDIGSTSRRSARIRSVGCRRSSTPAS